MNWYVKVLKEYANFHGRARRTEYWMFTLISTIVGSLLFAVDAAVWGNPFATATPSLVSLIGVFGTLYFLAVLLPGLAVGARRLHDTGRSAWWLVTAVVPIVGLVVLLVLFALDGDRGPNAHGADPKPVLVTR